MKVKIFITILLALIVSGCSVFKSSKKIDMTPFSDNAGILFSEAVKISRPFQWKHLKEYTFVPEFQFILKRATPLFDALNGIVYYSNQVVAINNAKLSNRDKNKQLARYLSDAMEKALRDEKIDSLQVDKMEAVSVLKNIQDAETYLDGIAAASPIAVAIKASEMPGATTASEALPVVPIPWKAPIIPQTVPNRPIKGAVEPVVARKVRYFSNRWVSWVVARRNARPTISVVSICREKSPGSAGSTLFFFHSFFNFCMAQESSKAKDMAHPFFHIFSI